MLVVGITVQATKTAITMLNIVTMVSPVCVPIHGEVGSVSCSRFLCSFFICLLDNFAILCTHE